MQSTYLINSPRVEANGVLSMSIWYKVTNTSSQTFTLFTGIRASSMIVCCEPCYTDLPLISITNQIPNYPNNYIRLVASPCVLGTIWRQFRPDSCWWTRPGKGIGLGTRLVRICVYMRTRFAVCVTGSAVEPLSRYSSRQYLITNDEIIDRQQRYRPRRPDCVGRERSI